MTENVEPASADQGEISKEARELGMLLHLLGLVGFFAPLIIWVNAKEKHTFVDDHGRAALNYHISIIIYYAVCWLLCLVIIGIFLLIALAVMHVVFVIIAAVKAVRGKPWQYPIAIRFLK